MAISGNNIGAGNHTSAATSVGIAPAINCTAGATVVLAIYYDNSGTNGADPFNTISDGHGNTWTERYRILNDPGAADAGLVLGVFTTRQDVATLTTGSTITIDFGAFSVTEKYWTITEFTSSIGYVDFVTGGSETGNSTSNTITTGSITSGNVAFVAQASDQISGTPTGDADTTNGNWSTAMYSDVSVEDCLTQYKITTGTGTQAHTLSYNGASGDYCAVWMELNEVEIASAQDPFGQFGFFGI